MGTEWVAVGLSRDLPAGVAMPALWQGRELAVWRSASGKLSAWNDRCPHRGMRVCLGEAGNKPIHQCIYHGWAFRPDGSFIGAPIDMVSTGPDRDHTILLRHPYKA